LFRRNRGREGEDLVGSGWFYFSSFGQGRESEICRLREGKTLTDEKGRGVKKGRLLVLVSGGSFQNVNLITTNQNQEQKLTKIFKLKQVRF